ncbi:MULTISPECIES: hypothetical protein [unclassified Clostridium]
MKKRTKIIFNAEGENSTQKKEHEESMERWKKEIQEDNRSD